MAAGEDQPQPLVGDLVRRRLVRVAGQHGELAQLGRARRVAAQPVGRAVAGRRGEPGARAARDAVARPASPARRRTRPARSPPPGPSPRSARSGSRRPDPTRPGRPRRPRPGRRRRGAVIPRPGGSRRRPSARRDGPAAISIASSRFAHSTTTKPPTKSLVSANGPSETRVSPSRTRTVVASTTGRSRAPTSSAPAPFQVRLPRLVHRIRRELLVARRDRLVVADQQHVLHRPESDIAGAAGPRRAAGRHAAQLYARRQVATRPVSCRRTPRGARR